MRQRIESLEQFRALQAEYMAARDAEKRKILVCCGTGCVAGGNLNVYHELKKRMDELGIPCEVSLTEHHADTIGLKKSGCHGFCEMGPLVRIEPEGWLYTKCQVSDVEEIIQKTILGGVVMLAVAFGVAAFLNAESPTMLMNAMFCLAGIGWATINVNSFPMVVEMCSGSDVGRYTGFYYTASMAAQVVTPMFSGFLMDKLGMTVLFPYAAIFVAGAFVTMLFVRHGDSRPIPAKGLEALDVDD